MNNNPFATPMEQHMALGIALAAHYGQEYTAHQGKVMYVQHPMAMSKMFRDEPDGILATAALLHDVVEDSAITLDDLLKWDFPKRVVTLVDYLTRREGESYEVYLERITEDEDAIRLKLADVYFHLNYGAEPVNPKYERAKEYLEAALSATGAVLESRTE